MFSWITFVDVTGALSLLLLLSCLLWEAAVDIASLSLFLADEVRGDFCFPVDVTEGADVEDDGVVDIDIDVGVVKAAALVFSFFLANAVRTICCFMDDAAVVDDDAEVGVSIGNNGGEVLMTLFVSVTWLGSGTCEEEGNTCFKFASDFVSYDLDVYGGD